VTSNGIVQKLWNYCNVLRDDGLSYGDYVEQLTYLPFLKMADEQTLRANRDLLEGMRRSEVSTTKIGSLLTLPRVASLKARLSQEY